MPSARWTETHAHGDERVLKTLQYGKNEDVGIISGRVRWSDTAAQSTARFTATHRHAGGRHSDRAVILLDSKCVVLKISGYFPS